MKKFLLILLSLAPVLAAEMKVATLADGIPLPIRNPYGVTLGPGGALYICDIENHRIWRLSEGKLSVAAGNGTRGYSGDGGPAAAAQLNEPYEVRFDKSGAMYFVEMRNHLIRKVAPDGTISTVAGDPNPGFAGDGSSEKVKFSQPHSLQFGPDHQLYVCDIGNHRVRKIDPASGRTKTFAGIGQKEKTPDGGKFAEVALFGPRALDFDTLGTIWLALREGNMIYRFDLNRGTLHHVAGTGAKGFTGNGGKAKEATLSGPKGLSVGPEWKVYFADTESHSIRMIDVKSGKIELVAGTGKAGHKLDRDPLKTELARPHGIYASPNGTVYIGDSENHRVLILTP